MTYEERVDLEEAMATAIIWAARERSKDGMTGIAPERARALAWAALGAIDRAGYEVRPKASPEPLDLGPDPNEGKRLADDLPGSY